MTSRLPRLSSQNLARIEAGGGNMQAVGPYLNARANLVGFSAASGKVRKATMKQTAAPKRHAPNPSNLSFGPLRRQVHFWGVIQGEFARLSHLDSANQASSSFDRSLVRSGM
jgi:hypothetical protein